MRDYGLKSSMSQANEGFYAKMNEATGKYYARYPYAGMTAVEKSMNDGIKSTSAQVNQRRTVLQYPDGYFDIDTSGYTSEQQEILNHYTNIAKVSDPRYLNSLTGDEFDKVIKDSIESKAWLKDRFTKGNVECKNMLDYADEWSKQHDKLIEAHPEYKDVYDRSKATRDDITKDGFNAEKDLFNGDGILEEYAKSISDAQKKESAVYAMQNGFSNLKDKAVDMFNKAKSVFLASGIGSKVVEYGKKAVDKVKTVFTKVKNRGEGEFSFGNNTASTDSPEY